MWILRRLVEIGVKREDLIMSYTERIRVMVESHVPLWSSSISKLLVKQIEKVQKVACFVILGKDSSPSYTSNLATLGLEPLEIRRDSLCKNLARKLIKHPVHRKMFTFKEGRDTRAGMKVIIPHTKTRAKSAQNFGS